MVTAPSVPLPYSPRCAHHPHAPVPVRCSPSHDPSHLPPPRSHHNTTPSLMPPPCPSTVSTHGRRRIAFLLQLSFSWAAETIQLHPVPHLARSLRGAGWVPSITHGGYAIPALCRLRRAELPPVARVAHAEATYRGFAQFSSDLCPRTRTQTSVS